MGGWFEACRLTIQAIHPCEIQRWCSREDSNLHGFPHTVLSRARLPIPPREQFGSGILCARLRLGKRDLRETASRVYATLAARSASLKGA